VIRQGDNVCKKPQRKEEKLKITGGLKGGEGICRVKRKRDLMMTGVHRSEDPKSKIGGEGHEESC